MKPRNIEFDEKLPLTSHLGEIRYRLIRILAFLFILFIICYYLSEYILEWMRAPIKDLDLIFINPSEPFFSHLKLGFFAALTLSIPFILYHAWAFISPGLTSKERHYTLPFAIYSTILFALGIVFAYYVILPLGMKFLLRYKSATLVPDLTISYYLGFAFRLFLIFGVIFEIPLVILFLTKIGIVKPAILVKNRKYAILVIFIVAAVLTPPDVVTQLLMAIPLLLLYEIGVLLSRMAYKGKTGEDSHANSIVTKGDGK